MNFENWRFGEGNGLEVLKIAGWGRFGWLRHGFSTRSGGISSVYGGKTLNLGWTKEDSPIAVAENRRLFLDAVCGADTGNPDTEILVGVRQIHSASVQLIREQDGVFEGRLQTAEGKAVLEGDGLITDVPGLMLGVGTADCVPVLIVDTERRVVGAFHAGWRGTAARIVERGVAMMRREYGSQTADLVAAIGPSIGACCYTVGDEVVSEFSRQFHYGEQLLTVAHNETRLNLWEANRRQLLESGIADERITITQECTACTRDDNGELKYFSHRGERGVAGRMLNVVGVSA